MDLPQDVSLVVLESTDVLVGGGTNPGKLTHHIQWRGRLFSVDTSEGRDSSALMDGTPQGQKCCREDLFPVGGVLVTEGPEHGVEIAMSLFH